MGRAGAHNIGVVMARRVLLIEDDAIVARVLDFSLASRGIEVTSRIDNFAGVTDDTDWSQYDAVLCDKQLDRYDGEDVLAYLAEYHPHIRRVLLTASADIDALHGSAAHRTLTKPCDIGTIADALGVNDAAPK